VLLQRPCVHAGRGGAEPRVFSQQESQALPQNVGIAAESRFWFHFKSRWRLRLHGRPQHGQLMLQRLQEQ
jgi:hypothetical protein